MPPKVAVARAAEGANPGDEPRAAPPIWMTVLQAFILYYLLTNFAMSWINKPAQDGATGGDAETTVVLPLPKPPKVRWPEGLAGRLSLTLYHGEPESSDATNLGEFNVEWNASTARQAVWINVTTHGRLFAIGAATRSVAPRASSAYTDEPIALVMKDLNFTTLCADRAPVAAAIASTDAPPEEASLSEAVESSSTELTPSTPTLDPVVCPRGLFVEALLLPPQGVPLPAGLIPVRLTMPVSFIRPKRIRRVRRRLLTGEDPLPGDFDAPEPTAAPEPPMDGPPPNVTYISPNTGLAYFTEFAELPLDKLPAFSSVGLSNSTIRGPHLYHYKFWDMKRDRVDISNVSVLSNITVTLSSKIGLQLLMMLNQFDYSFAMQENAGIARDGEADGIKAILLDNSVWYLALYGIISTLRMVFEYLAFKNDIQFWKSRKKSDKGSFTGLSVRSVAISCYFQAVIFLYLLDSEGTSWAVTLPAGIGVAIEFWKLFKCFRIVNGKLRWGNDTKGDGEDAEVDPSSLHDSTAIRYMAYVGAPLLAAYTVYCAFYEEQVGWYSFAIVTQVRAIYYAGFATMCPQIYINYKLRSVAAMPWRTFVYKALNTVVDDVFAFMIAMPTMHRVACFRDDLVFLVILYQRYIYPVDAERANEFGQRGVDIAEQQTDQQSKLAIGQPTNGKSNALSNTESKSIKPKTA